MVYQRAMVAGRVRLLQVDAGDRSREEYLKGIENDRRIAVDQRRLYASGEQFDALNDARAAHLAKDDPTCRLPEHKRMHAYSTHISECVEFLADQLTSSFAIEAKDPAVQEWITKFLQHSPELCPSGDEDDIAITEIMRDCLIAGDVAVHGRFDDFEQVAFAEFWESEAVRFDFAEDNKDLLIKVEIDEIIWIGEGVDEREVVRKQEWFMDGGSCRLRTTIGEQEPTVEDLRIPFIPWCLLRAERKALSAQRGESVITSQVMATADRFNAVEQTGWLIARYNSHSNVVVVGDGAAFGASKGETVEKDIADVLTFPAGTGVTALSLPTDPEMLEHQREVLLDSIFGSFGLARVDQTTIGNFSNLSGYALEILNRKTEGTFNTIRRRFSTDIKNMVSMLLDMQAAMTLRETFTEDVGGVQVLADDAANDVADMFPNRKMTVRMSGSYIADDVLVRDDFTAKLISRRRALLARGWSEEDIEANDAELADQVDLEPQVETPLVPSVLAGPGSTLTGASEEQGQDVEGLA